MLLLLKENIMQGSIMFDTRMESYGTFFKDDFGVRALNIAKECSVLERPAFELIKSWRSASYAGALPSLLATQLKGFHDAYTSEPSSAGMLKYSERVLTKLRLELPALVENGELCRAIQAKILDISVQLTEADRSLNLRLDAQSVWQDYLKENAFVMGVDATMRQTYLAIFGAYENFIISLLKIASNGQSVRVTNPDFVKRFRDVFGNLVQSAWLDARVNSAKLVRHALMHAGGSVTEDLKRIQKIPVMMNDDQLYVYPEHNLELYKLLQAPAFALLQSTVFRENKFEQSVDSQR
jgi:hypothetical protein